MHLYRHGSCYGSTAGPPGPLEAGSTHCVSLILPQSARNVCRGMPVTICRVVPCRLAAYLPGRLLPGRLRSAVTSSRSIPPTLSELNPIAPAKGDGLAVRRAALGNVDSPQLLSECLPS